jgi:hypothetical protein
MEDSNRSSVIKNIDMDFLPKSKREDNFKGPLLLPPGLQPYHPSLILPPIISYGPLIFPSARVYNNSCKDNTDCLYPPLQFSGRNNPALTENKTFPALVIKAPHLSPKKIIEEPSPTVKKAKFDFSIEALTAKDDTKRSLRKPLGIINTGETYHPPKSHHQLQTITYNQVNTAGKGNIEGTVYCIYS